MKKGLILILIALIVGAIVAVGYISNKYTQTSAIHKINKEYEFYKGKELLGTDVTTAINKALDSNERNEIPRDEKGFYIENDTNSIKVEIVMYNEDELKAYQMETIQKVGITGFIDNFNLIDFTCSRIEYHEKTKMVKKIVFEQVKK